MSGLRKLVIVSHVPHFLYQGRLYAYGPYAREIDIWADLFAEVAIAAPLRNEAPPGDATPFGRANIVMEALSETGGDTLFAKVWQLVALPLLVWQMSRAMLRADAVHIRCPGNVGLLGAILAPLLCRYRVAKYAGQWNGYQRERLFVRWQRWLLKSRWWGAPVTVYGSWPDQPPHVHAFFTSMMTRQQVSAAAMSARQERPRRPLRVLFAGRLAKEKRVEAFVEALSLLKQRGVAFEARLVGDGPERAALENQVAKHSLTESVRFIGALPFDDSLAANDWADCLVLPSRHSEGWPKVIAEAMCHGVLCIAVDHGQLGRMLCERGVLLKHGNAEEIAASLADFSQHPEKYEDCRMAAAQWAGQYSLDGLRDALAALLSREWKTPIGSHREGSPVDPVERSALNLPVKTA